MAIQGIQVPMYAKYTLFLYFSDFSIKKKKNNQKQTNNMKAQKKDAYAWRHDKKVQVHESMIPKADKKSSKESPALDRKN